MKRTVLISPMIWCRPGLPAILWIATLMCLSVLLPQTTSAQPQTNSTFHDDFNRNLPKCGQEGFVDPSYNGWMARTWNQMSPMIDTSSVANGALRIHTTDLPDYLRRFAFMDCWRPGTGLDRRDSWQFSFALHYSAGNAPVYVAVDNSQFHVHLYIYPGSLLSGETFAVSV